MEKILKALNEALNQMNLATSNAKAKETEFTGRLQQVEDRAKNLAELRASLDARELAIRERERKAGVIEDLKAANAKLDKEKEDFAREKNRLEKKLADDRKQLELDRGQLQLRKDKFEKEREVRDTEKAREQLEQDRKDFEEEKKAYAKAKAGGK